MNESIAPRWFSRTALLGASMAALVGPTFAWDEKDVDEPVIPQDLFGGDPLREEMVKLFQQVERNLEAIDVKLADAGAGEASLADVPDSGIDKLLRDTQGQSSSVVSDIDRILEIAQQMGGT